MPAHQDTFNGIKFIKRREKAKTIKKFGRDQNISSRTLICDVIIGGEQLAAAANGKVCKYPASLPLDTRNRQIAV